MRALVALILFAATSVALAQAYRWTDKNGKVEYGDVPPPGVTATPLKIARPGSARPAPGEAAKDKEKEPALTPEQAFQKRRREQAKLDEEAAKAREDAVNNRENCESSQAALRQLESGQRVAKNGPDGERTFMDDGERLQQVERTRKLVAQWCK